MKPVSYTHLDVYKRQDVIKGAPEKFIYSGIGDLVSNITALYDWKFEEENGKTIIDDFATMISKKAVNSFVRTEFKGIKDDLFLKELVDSLTLNGISMEIAGDSSPASGAEHLISHALDKFLERPELHGVQVGIATYIMAKVQNHRSERITKILKAVSYTHLIFEEGYGEIDHTLRYSNNEIPEILKSNILLFNRIIGSADEMASLINALSKDWNEKEENYKKIIEKQKKEIARLRDLEK